MCLWSSLMLLLFGGALLLPMLFRAVWLRTFHPEFRDLVMEAQMLKLDRKHLEGWSIPQAAREMPLHSRAPRPVEPPPGLLARLSRCAGVGDDLAQCGC